MSETKIEWAHYTFNPWIGCSKVHTGCTNCYAEADQDRRRGRVAWGPDGTRSKTSTDYWKQPLKWNRDAEVPGVRPRVFCASLADVFEDWDGPIIDHKRRKLVHNNSEIPYMPAIGEWTNKNGSPVTMDDLRRDLFALIDATPNLDWLLLTKRPENVRRMIRGAIRNSGLESDHYCGQCGRGECDSTPCFKNAWIGCSVSNQETADKAIPELLKCRDLAGKLFVSYEPATGPVDWWTWLPNPAAEQDTSAYAISQGHLPGLDLVIVGGESGPNARPCDIDWIRSTVEQCREAGVACFVKQLGSNVEYFHDGGITGNESMAVMALKHSKGGDMSEWPEDLRVREMLDE